MKTFSGFRTGVAAAIALLLLASAAAASPAFADSPSGGSLVVLADLVQGAPSPYPDVPPCVQSNRIPQGSKVVFRTRVIDGATGQALTDSDLSSVQVTVDGQPAMMAQYGMHPGGDEFWTAAWRIPADYPTGSPTVTVTTTANDGRTATWMPFQTATSLFTVIPAVASAPAASTGG
jgi:hypothetical protein